jgi:integrase
MANRRPLTDLVVKRLHAAGDPVCVCDRDGLYFRKQTDQGASWTLRYRFAGHAHWHTLGNYPDMTLAEARRDARQARVLLDQGQDPAAVKRARIAEIRRKGSFGQLCDEWYASEVEGKVKHPEVHKRYLVKYLRPALANLLVDSIRTDDILRAVNRLKKDHPTAANDLLRIAKQILDFAVRRHVLSYNPAASLTPRRDGGGSERPRTRCLTEDELSRLFMSARGSESFGEQNLLATKLLLALCVRKGELFAAKWSEFDLEGTTTQGSVWHLPASRTKTGAALDIPLVPDVVGALKRLQELRSRSEYVFPRRRHDKQSRYEHVLDHGLAPFTVHDFRRTARTILSRLGIRREVAERCLGHKLRGVEGTYNTHDFFDERRAALKQWTDLLGEIEAARSRVVPFRRGASA